MKKNRVVLAVVALGIMLLGFGFMQTRARAAGEKTVPNTQSIAVARRERIETFVKGTASVSANEKRTVKAAVPGSVVKVHVADGQPVTSGQVLISLKNEGLVRQMEQAQVELETQRVKLEASLNPTGAEKAYAESQLSQAESNLKDRMSDIARLQIASPIEGRVAAVRANPGDAVTPGQLLVSVVDDTEVLVMVQIPQSEISKVKVGQNATVAFGSELPATVGVVHSIGAEATKDGRNVTVPVAVKVSNKSRIYRAGLSANATIKTGPSDESVSAGGSVTPKVKYDMRAEVSGSIVSTHVIEGDSVKMGQPLVKISNQSLQALLEQAVAQVKVAEENLSRIRSGKTPNISESDLKVQALRQKQAEIALAHRMVDVDALQIKSPIDGVMVNKSVSTGDEIASGAVVCTVADYSKMTMVIPVDELDVSSIQLGQAASITVEALPGRAFKGEVTKIATEGVMKDGVANYDVTVTLIETIGLRGSMTATAVIKTHVKENALVIPAEAVKTSRGKKTVTVVRDGAPEIIDVKVGLGNGTHTEILSGINEGDSVVITAASRTRVNMFTGQEEGR